MKVVLLMALLLSPRVLAIETIFSIEIANVSNKTAKNVNLNIVLLSGLKISFGSAAITCQDFDCFDTSKIGQNNNHRVDVLEIPPFSRAIIDVTVKNLGLRRFKMFEDSFYEDLIFLDNSPLIMQSGIEHDRISKNSYKMLNERFRWVSKNIEKTNFKEHALSLSQVMLSRSGDCTEQATLFVAMARQKGIPSRVLGGYIMERSGRIFARDYHNWAEAYVDGRWIIVDPYYGVFDEGYDRYIAMHVVDYEDPNADNRRFWVEGEGLTVTMH